LIAVAGLSLLVAACGDDTSDTAAPAAVTASVSTPVSTPASPDSMAVHEMSDDSMAVHEMTDDSMADDSMAVHEMSDDSMSDDSMSDEMMLALWQSLKLTDVDGNQFTLADFAGRTVFVEHFATWCPKCRQQLADTNAAAAELGDAAAVIALSVETDLSASDVAEYAADNGFDAIRFAVMTPDFLAAVSDDLGNDAINPPSTPHYVIDSHGVVGELSTGSVGRDEIVETLRTAMS
jgi:thiol-disulfide isomerase/thioredoxin